MYAMEVARRSVTQLRTSDSTACFKPSESEFGKVIITVGRLVDAVARSRAGVLETGLSSAHPMQSLTPVLAAFTLPVCQPFRADTAIVLI